MARRQLNARRRFSPIAFVFAALAIDTLLCLGTALWEYLAESTRAAQGALPDTTWQAPWEMWFVITAVAWVATILLRAALADARRSAARRSNGKKPTNGKRPK